MGQAVGKLAGVTLSKQQIGHAGTLTCCAPPPVAAALAASGENEHSSVPVTALLMGFGQRCLMGAEPE